MRARFENAIIILLSFIVVAGVVVLMVKRFARPGRETISTAPVFTPTHRAEFSAEEVAPQAPPSISPSPTPSFEERLAFSAWREGNWDIYTMDAAGKDLRRLTSHPAEDRAPAFSPDGRFLAFQSHRDGNWEIYVVSAEGGEPRRLTIDPAYDGAPAWSPDGRKIAFESYRSGDLDIFIMNADGSDQINLTADEQAGDCDPAWSPDGRLIAFSSWRFGDKDIFVMEASGQNVIQLTNSPSQESNPIWSQDGQRLTYVAQDYERMEIYILDVANPPAEGGVSRRLTWLTCDDFPAWSPDGRLAFLSHFYANGDREAIFSADPQAPLEMPRSLLEGWVVDGPLSWGRNAPAGGEPVDKTPPLPERTEGPPYRFADLEGVKAPNARLHPALVSSFQALRERIKAETGYDFLAEVSDMWRPIDAEESQGVAYASWHKTGRAIDFPFEFRDEDGWPILEVVREDMGGDTYWRLFLKCALQDGSCGAPLKEMPWELSSWIRSKNPRQGGEWKNLVPAGYYVDLTSLAREHGWQRISSLDREEFSWRWHFLALDYWHYQQTGGRSWYEAMLEVYPQAEVEEYYRWEDLARQGYKEYILAMSGIPNPTEARQWHLVHP